MSEEAPVLVVNAQGSDYRLFGGTSYLVGRDPQSDVVFVDSRVSWNHAILRQDENIWILEDFGSTNGTFKGSIRIQRAEIEDVSVFRLAHQQDGPVMRCSLLRSQIGPFRRKGKSFADRRFSAVSRVEARALRIGRGPDNDVVVSDLSVSRHHAELRSVGAGRYEIVDLGSHNGTYVNGAKILTAPITEVDIIGIGHATFRLFGKELQEFIDEGDVSLIAHNLTIRIPGRKLLLDRVR
jgi:pSer/pThr/pTyr-binding forkhead associated (FHA) protein